MSLNPVFLAAVVLVAAEPARPDRRFDAKAVEFFEKKVRPVLVSNSYRRRPWRRPAPSSGRCATIPRGAYPAPTADRSARSPGRR